MAHKNGVDMSLSDNDVPCAGEETAFAWGMDDTLTTFIYMISFDFVQVLCQF